MKRSEYGKIGEQIYTDKLSNGLSVFVIPKPGFHKKYAFFATDYGGADRRFRLGGKWIDTPAGVAHFLEHKMFDTKDGSALEVLSANGANPNAFTSVDITAYHFECIDNFPENLETLLSFVSVPYFTPDSVEKEQGIITQEIRMVEDEPDFCLYYGLLKSLFHYNPIRDPVAGTVESIAEITAQTLYDCHKVFYDPSNMALCVVGDVDPSEISEIAQKVLQKEPGPIPERDYGKPEAGPPLKPVTKKSMEVSLPIFVAGCRLEPAAHGRDFLQFDIVSTLTLELLFGNSSPFFINLYADGLLNADFSASFDSAAGAAYTIFGGETRDPERVYAEAKDEIFRVSEQGPDEALLMRIKKAAIGSHIRALNSFGAIATSITEGHFRGYDAFEAPDLLEKVTSDDVMHFLRASLIPGNMALSVIDPI